MIPYTVLIMDDLAGKRAVLNLIEEFHYTNTIPRNSKYIFGLFDDGRLIGGCLFGPFSRMQANRRYAGCLELTRLFVVDGTKKNTESFFIARCLHWLKKNTEVKGIVSYADPNVGHYGTIYLASNFKFIGNTSKTYHYVDRSGKRIHIRAVWGRSVENGISEKKQAKHEDLKTVLDESKLIYFYSLRRNFDSSSFASNRDGFYDLNKKRLDFFKTWTRESAWVYGLILGDGNVHKSYKTNRVMFAGNESTVGCFCKFLDIKKVSKGRGVLLIYMDGKELVSWFEARGLCGKKSHSLRWPEDLPEQYESDFLRGLMDTDGTVTIDRPKLRGRNKLKLQFNSASKSFIQSFANKVGTKRKITENVKEMNGKFFTCYSVSIGGAEASVAFGDRIYADSEGMRNEERYLIYKKGKELLEATKVGCHLCGKPIKTQNVCAYHFFQEKNKDKPAVFCSKCGDPAFSEKFALCISHYYQMRRHKKAEAEGRKVPFSKTTFRISRPFGPQTPVKKPKSISQNSSS